MWFNYKKQNRFLVLLAFIFLFSCLCKSQSSYLYRRVSVLNGNNISLPFTNYGVLGQPYLGSQTPLGITWKGINNGYIGDLSIVVGVEFPIKDYTGDGKLDTLHEVIITPVIRPGGGSSGPGGIAWGFEPVNGFFNNGSNQVAMSNDPTTWPSVWPDHPEWGAGVWNGFLGPNNFVGTKEAYFQMDDRSDEKMFSMYGILPDSSHPEIKGNGISVNVRYIQLNNPLFKDMLFQIYDIKNESKYNYSKMYLGELNGTYIGGSGDEYNDDVSLYYPKDQMTYSFDYEPGMGGKGYIRPASNPNWQGNVGGFSQTFISPNTEIGSFVYYIPAGAIKLSDNNNMWNMDREGNFSYPPSVIYNSNFIPNVIHGEDGDYIFGTKYFSLASGETKRISGLTLNAHLTLIKSSKPTSSKAFSLQ